MCNLLYWYSPIPASNRLLKHLICLQILKTGRWNHLCVELMWWHLCCGLYSVHTNKIEIASGKMFYTRNYFMFGAFPTKQPHNKNSRFRSKKKILFACFLACFIHSSRTHEYNNNFTAASHRPSIVDLRIVHN